MNQSDLSLFQQAVSLAQSGQKQAAYLQLRSLVQTNSNEPNLWLWLAFTAPSLTEAEQSLTYLQRLEPYNSHLAGAISWLQAEKQKYQVEEPRVVPAVGPSSAVTAPQSPVISENPRIQSWGTTITQSEGSAETRSIFDNPYDLGFMVGLTIVGGIALGAITGVVAQLFYLIFLFPWLMGIAVAFVILWGYKLSKIRTLNLAIGLVIFMSLITYSAYQYTEFLFFKQTIQNDLKQEGYIITDAEIDSTLQKQVGATGFVGFLRATTKEGVTITPFHSSAGGGITLKGDLVWLYWIVELVAIVFFAVRRVIKALEEPKGRLAQIPAI